MCICSSKAVGKIRTSLGTSSISPNDFSHYDQYKITTGDIKVYLVPAKKPLKLLAGYYPFISPLSQSQKRFKIIPFS